MLGTFKNIVQIPYGRHFLTQGMLKHFFTKNYEEAYKILDTLKAIFKSA